MSDLTKKELKALEAEASQGKRKPTATAIPVRVIENVRLQRVDRQTIRRNLKDSTNQAGPVCSIEWLLMHYDSTAALYAGMCLHDFCKGTGKEYCGYGAALPCPLKAWKRPMNP